jgi:calcium-dependent protein kinase
MSNEKLVLKKQWFISNRPGAITDYYELDQKALGAGAFGTVIRGRVKGQSDNSWRAIKKIPKKKVTDKVEFLTEIELLSKLDHPNIIKLY